MILIKTLLFLIIIILELYKYLYAIKNIIIFNNKILLIIIILNVNIIIFDVF